MRMSTSESAYRKSMVLQRPCPAHLLIICVSHVDYVVTRYTREEVELREAEAGDWRPEGIDPRGGAC